MKNRIKVLTSKGIHNKYTITQCTRTTLNNLIYPVDFQMAAIKE